MLVRRLLVAFAAFATVFGASLVPAQADTVTDPYSTPGVHLVNDRYWRTTCSMYSTTVVRCTTDIYGTKVFSKDGSWYKQNDWVFNNLTYLPSPRANWANNNLGKSVAWTAADGRRWESECDTAATGRGACRQYVYSDVASEKGGVVTQQRMRVFNSLVKFQTSTVAWVKTIPSPAPARSDVPTATTPVPLRTGASKPAAPVAPKPVTSSQQQAVAMARDYLEVMAFSRAGLIEQLVYEGFSQADSTYGVDALGVNWRSQAVAMGASYLDSMPFSRVGLIEQLEYEGFDIATSTYAVDAQRADWYDQAAAMALSYLDVTAFSRQGLIEQLVFEGFTHEQAVYGVNSVGL